MKLNGTRACALGGMLASCLMLAATERGEAYDFKVCSEGHPATYVHVHTVSAFCHDRTPVDNGNQPLVYGCVSGSTAFGCLVDRVDFTADGGKSFSWSSPVGVAGGTFTLQQYPGSDPFVCYNGWRSDCSYAGGSALRRKARVQSRRPLSHDSR